MSTLKQTKRERVHPRNMLKGRKKRGRTTLFHFALLFFIGELEKLKSLVILLSRGSGTKFNTKISTDQAKMTISAPVSQFGVKEKQKEVKLSHFSFCSRGEKHFLKRRVSFAYMAI